MSRSSTRRTPWQAITSNKYLLLSVFVVFFFRSCKTPNPYIYSFCYCFLDSAGNTAHWDKASPLGCPAVIIGSTRKPQSTTIYTCINIHMFIHKRLASDALHWAHTLWAVLGPNRRGRRKPTSTTAGQPRGDALSQWALLPAESEKTKTTDKCKGLAICMI